MSAQAAAAAKQSPAPHGSPCAGARTGTITGVGRPVSSTAPWAPIVTATPSACPNPATP